ncbi:MAG: glutathione S-transferase family protein [Proteobacteria bacterium]|nr:glutathione S-transferase family protein [Pseudomonadota bacterium]
MKLYDENDPAPNPRRVRIFLKEKGVEIPLVHTSLGKLKHKAPEFLEKNPLGQLPVLELDDGTCISESVSICRYLESLYPEPPLFGSDAKESALIDMWIRRAEFRLMQPIGQIWVNTHPFTAQVVAARGGRQYTEYGESNRAVLASGCKLLDRELASRDYIAGDHYTMADIVAQASLDFGRLIGAGIPEQCANLNAWYARVRARPSATEDLSRSLLKPKEAKAIS